VPEESREHMSAVFLPGLETAGLCSVGPACLPPLQDQGADERDLTAALRALGEDFPGWHGWQSDQGWLWATRLGPRASFLAEHIPMTIDGATVDDLRRQLNDLAAEASPWAFGL
jgi:hypothetical protein